MGGKQSKKTYEVEQKEKELGIDQRKKLSVIKREDRNTIDVKEDVKNEILAAVAKSEPEQTAIEARDDPEVKNASEEIEVIKEIKDRIANCGANQEKDPHINTEESIQEAPAKIKKKRSITFEEPKRDVVGEKQPRKISIAEEIVNQNKIETVVSLIQIQQEEEEMKQAILLNPKKLENEDRHETHNRFTTVQAEILMETVKNNEENNNSPLEIEETTLTENKDETKINHEGKHEITVCRVEEKELEDTKRQTEEEESHEIPREIIQNPEEGEEIQINGAKELQNDENQQSILETNEENHAIIKEILVQTHQEENKIQKDKINDTQQNSHEINGKNEQEIVVINHEDIAKEEIDEVKPEVTEKEESNNEISTNKKVEITDSRKPLEKIVAIEEETRVLKQKIINLTGATKDNEYLRLKDSLINNMIRLDDIAGEREDDVRIKQKKVIKFVQECLDNLERNVVTEKNE